MEQVVYTLVYIKIKKWLVIRFIDLSLLPFVKIQMIITLLIILIETHSITAPGTYAKLAAGRIYRTEVTLAAPGWHATASGRLKSALTVRLNGWDTTAPKRTRWQPTGKPWSVTGWRTCAPYGMAEPFRHWSGLYGAIPCLP